MKEGQCMQDKYSTIFYRHHKCLDTILIPRYYKDMVQTFFIPYRKLTIDGVSRPKYIKLKATNEACAVTYAHTLLYPKVGPHAIELNKVVTVQ